MEDRQDCWYHYHNGEQFLMRETLVSGMAEQGVRIWQRSGNPDGEGMVLFHHPTPDLNLYLDGFRRRGARRPLAIYLGEGLLTAKLALRLLRAGAGDVIGWHSMASPCESIAAKLIRLRTVEEALRSPAVRSHLVGSSPGWMEAVRQAVESALFSRTPVLFTGETGTGKEMMARLIHSLDARPDKGGFIVLDCSSIVPELSGSEFFGHERGAFTNAYQMREGVFALADGGTLFLDELGELPAALQAEILRAIQEKSFRKVGSHRWQKADFRLVCATNRDLEKEMEQGGFRTDLYHRVAGWVIHLPPLRERREDILPLARHFLAESLGGAPVPEFDTCLQEYLLARDYPGNIRELRHLVHLMAMRHSGPSPITIGNLPRQALNSIPEPTESVWTGELQFEPIVRLALLRGMTLRQIAREASEVAIRLAVSGEGNLSGAANKLGVCRRTLELRRAGRKPKNPALLQNSPASP